MDYLKHFSAELVYGTIAIAGGVARYLNGYAIGLPFSWRILIASSVVAGFSGYMFALLGDSMHLPIPLPDIMAGVGGFFGDQTMKLLLEHFTSKVDNETN